ncbi:Protein of unknown function (DUF3638), putative [Angomonas deanei]|uniref:ubiquitinyl hydrolase 1 n=1 Tax=Angomonas deanei TaxID=59799 RepID=A0A7G2C564_9TRYP|nr:Protein of unknown function (DUF3638), putative [Angomonas deanei]
MECIQKLRTLGASDEKLLQQLCGSVLKNVNHFENPSADIRKTEKWLRYQLGLSSKAISTVSFEWICSALLSANKDKEMDAVNPFLSDAQKVQYNSELVLLMLLCNRSHFIEQAILALQSVLSFVQLLCLLRGASVSAQKSSPREEEEQIQSLARFFSLEVQPDALEAILKERRQAAAAQKLLPLQEEVQRTLIERLKQLTSAALDLLTAKRHYVQVSEDMTSSVLSIELDPRFLLFEFLFNIVLRARQVEMVNWFVSNIRGGNSRVQQMIMGQGKTTVVGPLLALILADGEHTVLQVMPTALLEQTRSILRRCFGVVLVKHIYSIQFDRNCSEDTTDVELLYQKLTSAEEDRSVVVAAPECVKSLFLKSIEQMHIIETVSTEEMEEGLGGADGADERQLTHAHQMAKKVIQRSNVADTITPILQLWKRGVLIMDEVDVLLHPLRSELNFPIGARYPIDLSGPRWRLPMHLIDAIFYMQQGRPSEDVQKMLTSQVDLNYSNTADGEGNGNNDKTETEEDNPHLDRLSNVRTVIQQGFEERALQRRAASGAAGYGLLRTKTAPRARPLAAAVAL